MIPKPKLPDKKPTKIDGNQSKLTLKKYNSCWYCLYNSKGQEMCEPQIFRNDAQAEAWARVYISTWYNWTLEIDYGNKKQRNSVPKQTD